MSISILKPGHFIIPPPIFDLGASPTRGAKTVALIVFSILPHVNKVMYFPHISGSRSEVDEQPQLFAAVDQTRFRGS